MSLADWVALAYLVAAWIAMIWMSFHLGLYSDDYWNLFEVNHRSGTGYLAHHLSRINSRYTYALLNKLMYELFFDPDHLFAPLYIRAARILVLSCHFIGVWFTYRSLVRLGVPKAALLAVLPFISFALFGDQGLFWLAAAYAYPVGFALFSGGIYALLRQKPVRFAVLAFFALGATEFVILPLLAAVAVYGYSRYRSRGAADKKALLRETLILIAPFVAWALIVLLTPAAASREAKVHGNPKLFAAPLSWAVSYITIYLRQMQPAEWMRTHWYIVSSATIVAAALLRNARERRIAFFLIALYPASLFPISAVGYLIFPVSHARLWYFPGLFFFIAVASSLGFFVRQLSSFRGAQVRNRALAATAVFMAVMFVFFAAETHRITQNGEDAFNCVRGFLDEVQIEADGRTPKRVEICGMPRVFHNFSVFLSPNCGRFALAILFDSARTIPFVSRNTCPKKRWGRLWNQDIFPGEMRYRITYR